MNIPKATVATGTEALNPTLSIVAFFLVPDGEDGRRTRLRLSDFPDIAGWLLTILDFILWKQGRVATEKRIAEPPDGRSRERLIDSRVILAHRREDGGLSLTLNPQFDLRLEINTRRRGQPACNVQLPLADDPELTRWLLTRCMTGTSGAGPAPLSESLLDSMRRYGILVSEPPPEDAWFPDPGATAELGAALAPMSRIFPQPAGQPIPAEVRQVLGRHTPALPPETDIVWGQDAGTGLVYPTVWRTGNEKQPALAAFVGADAARRSDEWNRQREEARESFRTRGYAIFRNLFPPVQREALRRYVRQLKSRGYFPELGDGQVALRASIHNEPTIASLHNGFAAIVNSIGVEPILPSYSFLSCYEEHAVLERHLDRPQCRYNVCFVLDMQYLDQEREPEPWPIYLELDGKPVPALLQVGDGVFFAGSRVWHWRDALPPGRRVVVCFSHYVPVGFTGSLE